MGGLVGPALGGLLADVSGLRAPFTMTGIAAAAAAVYGLLRLPETRKLGEARAERARAAEAMAEAEADAEAEAGPASSVRPPHAKGSTLSRSCPVHTDAVRRSTACDIFMCLTYACASACAGRA